MRPYLIVVLLISVIGCSKDKEEKEIREELSAGGIFKGTFQRQTNTGGAIVPITLELKGNTYSGSVGAPGYRYPVIGRGSFTVKDNTIKFLDSLYYTADFDWSLILSEEYKASRQGDSIVLSRSYESNRKDVYKLKKQ
jgi:hypothetical protein